MIYKNNFELFYFNCSRTIINNMAEVLKTLGNDAFKSKDYVKALEYYSQALQVDANNHVLYSNKSACYFNLNKFNEALGEAEKCIKIKDNWAKGYQRKGAAENALGQLWKAFVSFSIGKLVEPTNEAILKDLEDIFKTVSNKFKTQLLTLAGNPSVQKLMKDKEIISSLLNPTPDLIFEKCRDSQDFVEVTSLVLNVSTDQIIKDVNDYFNFKISKGLFTQGTQSNSEFNQTQQNNQSNSNTTQPQPSNNSNNSKLSKAQEAFNKANELFVTEEYDSALEQYDIACHHDQTNGKYLLFRASCYLKLGDDVLVLEDCNAAIKLGYKSSRIYYLKSEAYKLINKIQQAKAVNQEGLDLFPSDSWLLKQQQSLI